jgi:hypothetical protein
MIITTTRCTSGSASGTSARPRLFHEDMIIQIGKTVTFDHRTLKTRLPVRSALFKQRTGGLVVRWVTTGESPLLNVFATCISFCALL